LVRFAFAALTLSLAATPALAHDDDGAKLFNLQCKMCHGGSTMGPSLAGVYGAKIASKPDFAYSAALKAKEGAWTKDRLEAFLKNPSGFAPGTKMMLAVPSEESREAITHYLKTLK
jgi:cytochrome c